MDSRWIQEALTQIGVDYKTDFPLSHASSFRIGGHAAIAAFPDSSESMCRVLDLLGHTRIKYTVMGRGSNVLFADDFYDGVLVFTSHLKQIVTHDSIIEADAGALIGQMAETACERGLAGLEFLFGIPGSCGGAVFMNAGAYDGEIASVLAYSEFYDTLHQTVVRWEQPEHQFRYRYSLYADHPEYVILRAGFALTPGEKTKIRAKMSENIEKRKRSQPLEYPNAGSIFKRPPNGFAAQMIDQCGLKGMRIGDAQVSEKHAGFIVNRGEATSADVKALIAFIRQKVFEQFGVMLETEIRVIE